MQADTMEPTIKRGDTVLVMLHAPIGRNNVVAYSSPLSTRILIHRVVAVAGDRFRLRDGAAILNGTPLAEPYVAHPAHYELAVKDYTVTVDGKPVAREFAVIPRRRAWTAPDRVPSGCYVVLGDNRDESADSHIFGFLCPGIVAPRTGKPLTIEGRALMAGRPFGSQTTL